MAGRGEIEFFHVIKKLQDIFLKLSNIPTVEMGDTIEPEHHNMQNEVMSDMLTLIDEIASGVATLDAIRLTPLDKDPTLRPGLMWFIRDERNNITELRFSPDGRNVIVIARM